MWRVWVRIRGISGAVTSSRVRCYQKGCRVWPRGRQSPEQLCKLSVYQPGASYNCVGFFCGGSSRPPKELFHRAHQTNKCRRWERPQTGAAGQALAAWLPWTSKQIVWLKPPGKLWASPTHQSQSIWRRGKGSPVTRKGNFPWND